MARISFLTAVIVSVIIGISSGLAQTRKIYTWTDKDGVAHISQTPPPAGAEIDEVIPYQPKTAEQLEQIEARKQALESEAEEFALQNQIDDAEQDLRTARENAEAARARVEEAQADLELLRENVGQTKSRQRRFRYEIQNREGSVLEARQAALQAEEAVRAAEQRLVELKETAGQGSDTGAEPPSSPPLQ